MVADEKIIFFCSLGLYYSINKGLLLCTCSVGTADALNNAIT